MKCQGKYAPIAMEALEIGSDDTLKRRLETYIVSWDDFFVGVPMDWKPEITKERLKMFAGEAVYKASGHFLVTELVIRKAAAKNEIKLKALLSESTTFAGDTKSLKRKVETPKKVTFLIESSDPSDKVKAEDEIAASELENLKFGELKERVAEVFTIGGAKFKMWYKKGEFAIGGAKFKMLYKKGEALFILISDRNMHGFRKSAQGNIIQIVLEAKECSLSLVEA